MSRAWFDCIGGASGNMLLGALFDAGASPDQVRELLSGLPGWHFDIRQVQKVGLGGVHVDVVTPHEHEHRHLGDILRLLESVPEPVRGQARRIFERLAQAEAHVHRVKVEEIHFHEVGAVDAIVDVVGTCAALHLLGVEEVRCSPLPVGHGQIRCAHGLLPNPPPATVELTRGVPVRPVDIQSELVTPTAAAILTTLATEFTPLPPHGWDRVGYGAG
ncbi:MAG: nickel pincer cofactor biosynthesis protein LarC, partial [Candidatus Xenobia bacterium]